MQQKIGVVEELKQRTVAIAGKIGRYQKRLHRFRQNSTFQNNQRQFHNELNQIKKEKNVMMISLRLKNRKCLGETFGVSQYTITGM